MKEKLSTLLVLLIFFLLNIDAYSQDSKWSVGIQAGRTQLSGFTRISYEQIPEFEAQGMGGINIQVYGRYNIYKKVSVFASGGINNLVSGMRFQGERGRNFQTSGVTPQFFAGLDYDIPFGNSGFGILSKLAFGITGSNANGKNLERYQMDEDDLPLIGYSTIRDEITGNVENRAIYLRDVEIVASENKFIHHIRPELSFYKKFDRHQFSISAVYAFAPSRDFYTENFYDLEYKGNSHTAGHHFGGHYTALLFGYEFRF
jgi:hypothetical protein